MTIYKISRIISDFEYSPYYDDYMPIDKEEVVKYVDSKKKVDAFLEDKDNAEYFYEEIVVE